MERTPRCQRAIDHAAESYCRLSHSQLTSAHLVYGLLTLNGGVGDTVLKDAGLSAEMVDRYLSTNPSQAEEMIGQEGLVFGRSATNALARAEMEAAAFHHTILGVEHLTLALLAEEAGGAAAALFNLLRVDSAKLIQKILEDLGAG